MIRTGSGRTTYYANAGDDLPVGTVFTLLVEDERAESDIPWGTLIEAEVVLNNPESLNQGCQNCVFSAVCRNLREDYSQVTPVCGAYEREDHCEVYFRKLRHND